ncbi:MAG: site-specific integrase [Nitrospirota bacterium]
MINIPTDILSQYSSILAKKSIPIFYQYDYKKWLRYYLDFCHKSCPETTGKILPPSQLQVHEESGNEKESVAVQWKKVHTDLLAEIKIRHYSPKTLKVYAMWVRRFQSFTQNKSPLLFSSYDVKEFLKYLAIRQNVSASTQNQAFNALLFLFRYVLKKDFGDYRDCVRAKRTTYIPVVLSRDEIDAMLTHLSSENPLFSLISLLVSRSYVFLSSIL